MGHDGAKEIRHEITSIADSLERIEEILTEYEVWPDSYLEGISKDLSELHVKLYKVNNKVRSK